MHYQGIFFDFDYTLGDSTIPILRGYQEGFRALGWDAPTLEQVRLHHHPAALRSGQFP